MVADLIYFLQDPTQFLYGKIAYWQYSVRPQGGYITCQIHFQLPFHHFWSHDTIHSGLVGVGLCSYISLDMSVYLRSPFRIILWKLRAFQ